MYNINNDRNQLVVSKLTTQFGNAIIAHQISTDMLCLTVEKNSIENICSFLKNDNQLQFNFLTTMCGMHYPETNQLGVVYHLHSFVNNHRIRIKTTTNIENPEIQTITTIWDTANWMEREAFDFYGIKFKGHPNLVRILNTDDFEGFPMRKEFPLEDQTREDKDDSYFGR